MCNNLVMIYCILTKSLDARQYDYDKNDEEVRKERVFAKSGNTGSVDSKSRGRVHGSKIA